MNANDNIAKLNAQAAAARLNAAAAVAPVTGAAKPNGATPPNSDSATHLAKPVARERFDTTKAEHAPPAIAAPKPKSRDINDIKTKHGADAVRDVFDRAVGDEQPHGDKGKPGAALASAEWPEPDMRLVDDDCVSAPKLPDDALPAGWESWITTEAAARDCPRDYVAAGLIGAGSAWVGNARRIVATADCSEPAHLWMVLIGAPSAGKTPALKPMIQTGACWSATPNRYGAKRSPNMNAKPKLRKSSTKHGATWWAPRRKKGLRLRTGQLAPRHLSVLRDHV